MKRGGENVRDGRVGFEPACESEGVEAVALDAEGEGFD